MKLSKFYLIASTTVSLIILLCALATAETELTIRQGRSSFTIYEVADAIYWAEGGERASKPYGILSVPCNTVSACRRICLNTIRNNIKRYEQYGHKDYDNYLEFLASRYAPIGVDNDPTNLNKNWIGNVLWYLQNPKLVKGE